MCGLRIAVRASARHILLALRRIAHTVVVAGVLPALAAAAQSASGSDSVMEHVMAAGSYVATTPAHTPAVASSTASSLRWRSKCAVH